MTNITNLSQLFNLLDQSTDGPIEISIDPSLRESLQGCLTLGIKGLLNHVPGALPPRVGELFVCKHGEVPKLLVKITDFAELAGGQENLADTVKVTGNLLQQSLGWVEECCRAPRMEKMLNQLDWQIEQGPAVIEVPAIHIQEIIDWLDQIQRGAPNDLAEEIRQDVKALNGREMLVKIKWTNYGWD